MAAAKTEIVMSSDKITDKINALGKDETYFSLEFFPPKTAQGALNLQARLERMARGFHPLFVNVTWGAGGSTAIKSLELAAFCQSLGLTTCLHMTCTNMSRTVLNDALSDAKHLGIRNILALRGDAPRDDDYRGTAVSNEVEEGEEKLVYAVDLVKYIKAKYGDWFCIGVAGYPEGHAEGSHPETQDAKEDLPYLREKVKAGAEFIISQLFFDVEKYANFEKMLREDDSGVFKTISIIPGLMPVQSYQILQRTTKLSHASIPPTIREQFNEVKGDDEAVKLVGVKVLSDIIKEIISVPSPISRGFHFYTLNLEKAVAFVLERCRLIADVRSPNESAVEDGIDRLTVNGGAPKPRRRRSSVASDPYNRVIVDKIKSSQQGSELLASAEEAGKSKLLDPRSQENNIAISEGEGSLGREATWDDFPNGRWGDARSPAYGEIDGYGVSLHISPAQAIKLWATPESISDISELFVRNLQGKVDRLPWSDDSLRPESNIILNELVRMNTKGWWTVASQPAVNGAPSGDETYGWGPKNGYVFQKAFVEFFLPSKAWEELEGQIAGRADEVAFYAGNKRGDYVSSTEEKSGATNAVTWGAFPGKEIQTPTIIEEVSFKAWRDEAFTIWDEWQRVYSAESASAKLLGQIADDYWLVTLIHHDYLEPQGLWGGILKLTD